MLGPSYGQSCLKPTCKEVEQTLIYECILYNIETRLPGIEVKLSVSLPSTGKTDQRLSNLMVLIHGMNKKFQIKAFLYLVMLVGLYIVVLKLNHLFIISSLVIIPKW